MSLMYFEPEDVWVMQCVRLYVYACLLHERRVYVLCCVACMSLFFYISPYLAAMSDIIGSVYAKAKTAPPSTFDQDKVAKEMYDAFLHADLKTVEKILTKNKGLVSNHGNKYICLSLS